MFLQVDPLGVLPFAFSGVYCLCYLIFFILWIYMLFWIYNDAKRRGSSGALWVVLFFFFSWIALIIWLIVRGPIQSNVQFHHHYHGVPPPAATAQFCPTCGQPMRLIQQYNRWYCNYCRQYK
ncbi:MAG: hypothetical protein KAR56_03610 [Thermoplasmata archaeon]|nr:hypothetical protein [Thermoplasmata archaeon]